MSGTVSPGTPGETALLALRTNLSGAPRVRFAARMSGWALRHAARRLWPVLALMAVAVALEVAWLVNAVAGELRVGILDIGAYAAAGAGITAVFLAVVCVVDAARWWRLLARGDWIVVADPDAVMALHRVAPGRWRAQDHMARPGARGRGKQLRDRVWAQLGPDLHDQALTIEGRAAHRKVADLYRVDAAEHGLTLYPAPRRWPMPWREVVTTATPATQAACRAARPAFLTPAERRDLSVTLAVLAYLVAFGLGVSASVYVLFAQDTAGAAAPAGDAWRAVARETWLSVVGIACAAGAAAALGRPALREWGRGRPGAPAWAGPWTFGIALAAMLAGYWLIVWWHPVTGVIEQPARPGLLVELFRGTRAGLDEELIVLALPVVLLRAGWPRLLHRRWPLVAVVAGLVAARMAYHLYYGTFAFALVPWALVAALLYIRWGQVWPLIIEHAFYNSTLAFFHNGSISRLTMFGILHGAAAVAIVIGFILWLRRPQKSRKAPE